MNEEIKKIDISPHRSILTKISQTGYSIQEALSELIDNSIDASVDGEKLRVTVNIAKDYIVVSDNGKGMTEEQFGELMAVVGLANDTNRLVNGYGAPIDERFKNP